MNRDISATKRGLTNQGLVVPYTASVPLYAAPLDGFTENPVERLRSRRPFLQLSAWLLGHPTVLLGEESRKEYDQR